MGGVWFNGVGSSVVQSGKVSEQRYLGISFGLKEPWKILLIHHMSLPGNRNEMVSEQKLLESPILCCQEGHGLL